MGEMNRRGVGEIKRRAYNFNKSREQIDKKQYRKEAKVTSRCEGS